MLSSDLSRESLPGDKLRDGAGVKISHVGGDATLLGSDRDEE
jgi:hypothetical protein